jgi:polysaccharide export outer membrane protein
MDRFSVRIVLSTVASLTCLLQLCGCVTTYTELPAGTRKSIEAQSLPIVERQAITVPPLAPEPPPSSDYLIGVGDVLAININGRPEFAASASSGGSKVQGSRVDGNGRVSLPLVGAVPVAGLSLSQAQVRIQEASRKFLQDPWVVVEVAEYRSRPLYLLGQFRASGTYYLDRPLTLVQGVALGSGFDGSANLRGARLSRDNRIVPVDIYDLLTSGDQSQNVWLKSGDTLFIPDNRNQQVFIFGSVKKPGPLPIPVGGINLAQAIASAELRDIGYDFRYVRIIRSLSTTRGELLVVDFDKMLRGEALPFQLAEGDIVYVPRSSFGDWNDAIAEILPSLQLISAILQPFVSIKYLSN